MDSSPETKTELWRNRRQRLVRRLRALAPFASGVGAALLALLLYRLIAPPTQQLTLTQVNEAVAQAMASATPEPAYSAQVYRAIQPSLVFIQSNGQDSDGKLESGIGSGVVISDQGAILTALHVVEDATDIEVTFADGSKVSAQIATEQPESDIAVLQIDQLPPLLVPAVLGNPFAMQVGDEAFAVGNPFGLYSSMSAGVVSGFNRSFETPDGEDNIEGLIQIDTAVNPGNSGGPLLNRSGHVVGIVVGILNPVEEEFFVGIGFAVPITVAASGAGGGPRY
jgi:S1-C subfamily serine protease